MVLFRIILIFHLKLFIAHQNAFHYLDYQGLTNIIDKATLHFFLLLKKRTKVYNIDDALNVACDTTNNYPQEYCARANKNIIQRNFHKQ